MVSAFQNWRLFDVADKEHGKSPKKYEDVELQALLDEDDSQTQKQLVEQLSVNQQAVSNRLREMGKIQKIGRWMPHELNERQMERRKNTCEILLERYRRKSFLHCTITGNEKWIFFENPKRKKSWVDPGAHRPQDRIALARRRCSVFGRIRRVWSIMSY